jgi:hypothetical protein
MDIESALGEGVASELYDFALDARITSPNYRVCGRFLAFCHLLAFRCLFDGHSVLRLAFRLVPCPPRIANSPERGRAQPSRACLHRFPHQCPQLFSGAPFLEPLDRFPDSPEKSLRKDVPFAFESPLLIQAECRWSVDRILETHVSGEAIADSQGTQIQLVRATVGNARRAVVLSVV